MPSTPSSDDGIKFPSPDFLTLGNFKRGVITLIDKSRTPKNALIQADNIFLAEDGQPSIRWGCDWYGSPMPNSKPIDGFDYFDFNGVIHIVAVAGGGVYRSTDDANTWQICTGATFTAGYEVNFNQNSKHLYITTGVDVPALYDGTTTLVTYQTLVTPAAPTANVTNGGTGYTTYYKLAAVNQIGFSQVSDKVTVVNGTPRDGYDKVTHFVTLTLPAYQASQTRFDIYYSNDNLSYFYLDSVSTPDTTYKDDGTAIVVPSTTAPLDNTTQGPDYEELVNVGIRQFGVRSRSNRYRIGFTGTGNFSGAFSNAYDGGYLDWQPGGKYIPTKVVDYRDGKGTPMATVFCDSADGEGCILQMSLDTLTIGNISVTVPSAYKIPGSRGTPAPHSVINVLNDYFFYNTQAIYNLGSRAQFQNLLSTDEASVNIRNIIRQITAQGEKNIATCYLDGKVFFSVAYGGSVNNATIVYDTERQAWLPYAFTIGFKKFLKYIDTNRTRRLLAVKPGDVRLTVIDSSIQGDYGQAFNTDLTTGLYPVSKNRFDFQYTEEMEYEFSNPQGKITVELLGIDRTKGFTSVQSKTLTAATTVTNAGWDTFDWDKKNWDDTSIVPTTTSESSMKRYSVVGRELNAIQWHIATSSIDAKYVLRTLQTWGTDTQAGHPASWRI